MSVDPVSSSPLSTVAQTIHAPAPSRLSNGIVPSQTGDNSQAIVDKTIVNRLTVTHSNDTVTVTTTYNDGTSSAATKPNPNLTIPPNPLAVNSRQLDVLQAGQPASPS